ncbi:MAG: bleomycin resistance family protein [Chelatococcus sp.]|nr:MAG: bleomycin resistance family protein [Chelatococcus sp.]
MSVTRDHPRPRLVPELNVTDLGESLAFWRDLLGFHVVYDRPEQGFASIARDGVEFMLEVHGAGPAERANVWDTGELRRPFGRGINFEITVADVAALMASLSSAGWPLFFGPEERWYRVGDEETGVHQFLVQDPDGYLLRFSQPLGRRPRSGA